MIDPVHSAAENRYTQMVYFRRGGRSGTQIPVVLSHNFSPGKYGFLPEELPAVETISSSIQLKRL